MNYRHMIVVLDNSPKSREHLHFSIQLATAYGATLTGLYITYVPIDLSNIPEDATGIVARFQEDQSLKERRARDDFLKTCEDINIKGKWVVIRSTDIKAAIAYTRSADLIVAGQRLSPNASSHVGENFLDRLITGSGRPVLVSPESGPLPTSLKQVAIAWNGSREAARAVADAMPILKQAELVTALQVMSAPERHQRTPNAPMPDLKAFLEGHDVNVEMVECLGSMDTGNWILARASGINMQADLLVAGAYGHSRISEIILGGVTRTLLREASMPLLMSH